MTALTFPEARRRVVDEVRRAGLRRETERVSLEEVDGRVLAAPVNADRDLPSLCRSLRDGYAVRASEFSGCARLVGEVRAGGRFHRPISPGEAVEIMTGAPLPEGADAVIMVEHAARQGEFIIAERAVSAGDHILPAGAECRAAETLLSPGLRLDYAHVALLASVGCTSVPVFRRPSVAVIATGDELVPPGQTPEPHQIRNSNSYSLAAQVRRAGALPHLLPVARDNPESTRSLIRQGLDCDLLLISGGVSAGKYDIVEAVLREFDAIFFFDRVLIQPGQPLVFGHAAAPGGGRTFFFGLPGNPVSTMVTFALFAQCAMRMLEGEVEVPLPILQARLAQEFRHRPGLTRFLPARLSPNGAEVTPLPWHGSSDIPAVARANCFLVAEAEKEFYPAGDFIGVLPR